jgi:predicted phosphodiesterase
VRIFAVSDLHVDQYETAGDPKERLEFAWSTATEADVIVVAGDVHTQGRGPRFLARAFPGKPVVYVAGNHEFAQGVFPDEIGNLRGQTEGFPDVRFLENQETIIGGVAFLGCTLWTDFGLWGRITRPAAIHAADSMMPEYRQTRLPGGRLLTPAVTRKAHWLSRAFLEEKLKRHRGRKVVVISHHAPSARSIAADRRGDLLAASFASDLDRMIAIYQPALWVHGHTHGFIDYTIGATRIVCNAVGYPEAPSAYRPDFLVEI